MIEEKQESQADPNANQEQDGQPDSTAQPQESLEELKEELGKAKAHISTLQGTLKAAQRRGVSEEKIQSLHEKIDNMQEWVAGAMDDLANRVSGEEEVKPGRKTYRQQLEEKRTSKPQPEPPADVKKLMGYLDSQGIAYDDPMVDEAVTASNGNFPEALKVVKDKVKAMDKADTDKRIAEGIRIGVEQEFTKRGLTASGPDSPSASAGWRDLSPQDKVLRGVSGKK